MTAILTPLISIIFFLASCTKGELEKAPDCALCSLVSEKYSNTWKLVRVDTLYKETLLCGNKLEQMKRGKPVDTLGKANCPELMPGVQFEIRKYFIKY